MEIIISLTTSPKRILLMEPVINSILNQSVEPSYIRINIPKFFKRTNTPYIIPDFIKNNKKIKIFEYEEDLGPIMKILPTMLESEINNIYIYCDDDHLWLPNVIEGYIDFLQEDDNNIYCYSGFNYINNDYILNLELREIWYKNRTHIEVTEGCLSVCITGKILNNIKHSIEDYNSIIMEYKQNLTCDDMILSNFYLMNNIKSFKIHTDTVDANTWWNFEEECKKIIQYGFEDDALHNINVGGHINAYKRVYEFLKQKNINYFK